MAKAVVKHRTTGEKYRIVGQFRDYLWLQLKSAPNDSEPFTAPGADYEMYVETEPVIGEIWEHQRGNNITQRTVRGIVEVDGVTLVVWENEQREQVAATDIVDFVRTHKFNGRPAVSDVRGGPVVVEEPPA